MKIKTWQQWLQHCKDAWHSEGGTYSEAKTAHEYLKKAPKSFGDSLQTVASKAWKLYKQENA